MKTIVSEDCFTRSTIASAVLTGDKGDKKGHN